MKFWEAMKAVEEGKSVRKKDWTEGSFIDRNSRSYFYGIILPQHPGQEWELYEEPQKTYSFMEVVKGLKEGKMFKRRVWKECYEVLQIHPSARIDFLGAYEWGPIAEDFAATDWVEVK